MVSIGFARDVHGATGIGAECDPVAGGTHLVTLNRWTGESPIEYRVLGDGPNGLARIDCGAGSKVVVGDLSVAPS